MDFFFKGVSEKALECPFNEQDIQRCPFLRNIDRPTNFSFSSLNFPAPVNGAKGPIFEDGSSFDTAFKLFHGKDGVVPLSGRSHFHNDNSEAARKFNPLAAKTATISLSGFGAGGPFSFDSFSEKRKVQTKISESSKKSEKLSKGGDSLKHEALGNEWLEKGNCPIAKSYRAVSGVLPLVASSLRPPPGLKLKCPPAIVAARAALAKTTLVKNLRPQPLLVKILKIGLVGMAANVPLGIWREHTQKFSLAWFIAVHAAVPFIAMLRKSVNMPKTAMAFTIAASVLGQVIGSRAERIRLRSIDERRSLMVQMASVDAVERCNSGQFDRISGKSCGVERFMLSSLTERDGQDASSSAPTSVCV